MFDEFIKELNRLGLGQGVQVPIELPLDDKAYLDRRCPHVECCADFKVLFDDWRDKVPEQAAYCPKCGAKEEPSEFNTDWQNRYIQEVAEAYVSDQLDRAFSRAARRTRPQRVSAGLFDLQMTVSYHAGPTAVVLPPSADEALRQDFTCESCSCRYSAIGAGYFCPACGHNSAIKDFDSTIETALKAIDGMEEIRAAVAAKYDEDVAANIEQQVIEDQVENLVTALQRVAEALFRELPNAAAFSWDQNQFQRLQDSSKLWKRATGAGYEDFLAPAELGEMEAMIQRRHKLGHCQGIVDQRYIDKTGDVAYTVGQRLVTASHHVKELAGLVSKLVNGLRSLVAVAKSSALTSGTT
jgi:uncharacterized Zn finger protein (UPF0148 family)